MQDPQESSIGTNRARTIISRTSITTSTSAIIRPATPEIIDLTFTPDDNIPLLLSSSHERALRRTTAALEEVACEEATWKHFNDEDDPEIIDLTQDSRERNSSNGEVGKGNIGKGNIDAVYASEEKGHNKDGQNQTDGKKSWILTKNEAKTVDRPSASSSTQSSQPRSRSPVCGARTFKAGTMSQRTTTGLGRKN